MVVVGLARALRSLGEWSQGVNATHRLKTSGYREAGRRSEVTVTNSTQEGPVTRASLREYAAVQRERYRQATRAEKRQLLG